ncbi:hypothetical protein B0T16DRAFT_170684 [Cercophora newfieldiana]|uniref:Uncharacterized protein n=1 Tax=Cercophora newfieldiana TaxID=92897 RepID=A0AA40CQF4_9PEZI|nr:hypothetical protein B0T16DRAFT_170684 [Cercophora newfieldiana]
MADPSNTITHCYAIPYGWPGFIGHILNLYVLLCTLKFRSPLCPIRQLRYHAFNGSLATVQIVGCLFLGVINFIRCFKNLGLVFVTLSSLLYVTLLTLPVAASAARSREAEAKKQISTQTEYGMLDSEQGKRRDSVSRHLEQVQSSDVVSSNDKGAEATPEHLGADDANTSPKGNITPGSTEKRPSNQIRLLSFRGAIVVCLGISPTIYPILGTYLVLQSSTIDQNSSEAETARSVLLIISAIASLCFVLGSAPFMYRRYQAEGWRGLKAMNVSEFWGGYSEVAGDSFVAKALNPWSALMYVGAATTLVSNWVLAMAAGGNTWFPDFTEESMVWVAACWMYFVVSKVTLLSV